MCFELEVDGLTFLKIGVVQNAIAVEIKCGRRAEWIKRATVIGQKQKEIENIRAPHVTFYGLDQSKVAFLLAVAQFIRRAMFRRVLSGTVANVTRDPIWRPGRVDPSAGPVAFRTNVVFVVSTQRRQQFACFENGMCRFCESPQIQTRGSIGCVACSPATNHKGNPMTNLWQFFR